MAEEGKSAEVAAQPDTVEAHYIKSTEFRTIHVDGVWGGLTPTGYINATFWSQRIALPRWVEYKVSHTDGSMNELRREGKNGVVREMEVNAVFDINFAISLRDWLDSKIKEHKQVVAMQLLKPSGDPVQ